MNHYRNYKISVNGIVNTKIPFFSVEAVSKDYIDKEKANFIKELIKNKHINENDKVSFVFAYVNT